MGNIQDTLNGTGSESDIINKDCQIKKLRKKLKELEEENKHTSELLLKAIRKITLLEFRIMTRITQNREPNEQELEVLGDIN